MLETFPYIPLFASVRVAVAIFSYDGALSFGISGEYDTAPDIDVLSQGVEHGLAQLVRLARPSTATTVGERSGAKRRPAPAT